ncbi:non-ribosomal peptide synthetase [Chitinophaga flava]|uniref:Non-ribosomal peptide synthetase n=1 Tax=Chitinophaga flava TaxID=2259036 RepID=A0A365XVV6_9BACT|nr:non-ribosomal peptide synthetase [Chitinophaga flava]RBL90507.1 non-ribosomal peptide synthetase [Chitinophaga flava]
MIENVYPLSPLQQGLYFHWLNAPGASFYFEQTSYRIKGKLDIALLEKSYQMLVARHAVLRTFFTQEFGESLLQVVRKEVTGGFIYKDVSLVKDFSIEDYKKVDRAKGFDLHSGSQMRLSVLELGEDSYEFVWCHHHILMDGWCVGILVKEFLYIYHSLVRNTVPVLGKVYPYSNYIEWLGNINKDVTLQYWQHYLTGYNRLSSIPSFFRREESGYDNREMKCSLPEETKAAVKDVCGRLGITENIFMQAMWGILLGKYNNTNDVVFGSVVSGRPAELEGVEEMIGLFINTIPVRVQVQKDSTIRSLLRALQETSIESSRHHYVQLAEIQSESELGRDLFDHIMIFENYPAQKMIEDSMEEGNTDTGPSLELFSASAFEQTNYDFTVTIIPGTTTTTIQFNYNGIVYTENQIVRLCGHLLKIITLAAKNPDLLVTAVDYLSTTEKDELLGKFNDTARDYPDKLLVAQFEEQVSRRPGAIALEFEGRTLSYAALNALANQLGNYLRSHYHIGAGDLVAVKLPRSEWMLITILGILKSGGAYIPVDPVFPKERIDYILSDSGASMIIDEAALAAFLEVQNSYSSDNLPLINQPGDIVYVIYTSGSTGAPKGVMVEHAGMLNHLYAKIIDLQLNEQSVVAQNAVYTFDISFWQMFAALVCGGKTIIYPEHLLLDPAGLLRTVAEDKVTILELVPSYMTAAMQDEQFVAPDGLRFLLVTGEAVNRALLEKWFSLSAVPVVNAYGPTEASDDICHFFMYETPVSTNIPLGKPIQNLRIYILDKDMQLCPPGISGEICVSGIGVSRGYLNRETLTASRFIADPFRAGNHRLYRTGDLGYWLPDGNIAYLGRMDEQVKIRGHRIELGEIENALQRYPGIDAAAVTVVQDKQGEKVLAAYIAGNGLEDIQPIHHYLKGLLPVYMLPAHYIPLAALPLTANGKLDRRALPGPEGTGLNAGAEYVAPSGEAEKKLVLIWQEVLGKKKIGIKDNFLDQGGHSLKLMRLATVIHREFDVKIPLKDLFANLILEDQAKLLSRSSKTAFVTIAPAEARTVYPLSSSQRRLWILSQFEESNIAYNIPGVFRFHGNLDTQALTYALNSMVERHEILRTVFREDETGNIMQVILPVATAGCKITGIDLRHAAHPRLDELVNQSFTAPFNLAEGPLLRTTLYQLADDEWVFAYVLHHIISDGVSMGILMKELLLLYNTHMKGEPAPLVPLRIQYKDYAVWQQEQLSGDLLKEHSTYWMKQFEGILPVLQMPYDRPRPVIQTYSGRVVKKLLDRKTSENIKALCQEQGATLFMGLLAAVNILLFRYTNGDDDIIIGTPVAGREHADLEGQIGVYINTLALRTKLMPTDRFRKVLEKVRQVTLDAYEHQVYPFDELVDALKLPRDTSRHPLFDVMVELQHQDDNEEGLDGISVRDYEEAVQVVSKFDLQFSFTETANALQLSIEYNTDIYEHATAERLSLHLESLLEAILALPATPIAQIDFLSREEKELLQYGFNDTTAVYPHDKTLTALFEEQASLIPADVALIFEDRKLSYRELNEEANRLGHYLRAEYGIGPEDLVVVQLERSEWLVIALLGVLKSGGAYVPLDPSYPPEHRDYILSDSGSRVVLDETELQRFRLQRDTYDSGNPVALAGPESLAYVIYTSGSTGRPKGCMLEHGGVVNRLSWMWEHYGFDSTDVVLQKTSFTFDVSVWELFLPICWGARLVLCRREDAGVPDRICSLIRAHGVTCVHFVPGMLHAFIASLSSEDLSGLQSLRRVITSGEALSVATVQGWYHWLDVPLHNLYGPTEASIDVSWYATTAADVRIPIGRPVQNIRLYIIGPDGQLQPPGVAGEICIAGVGVARGYLNRAELTAEKFIRLPYEESSRVYRSGDLGRWLPDGNIEYLGRMDDQVKIRGYRIELGEIELALQCYEGMTAAVVIARINKSGEKELVAYLVSKAAINVTDIRRYLSAKLPAYMLPAHYVQLDQLPVTTNGKIYKSALPDIDTLETLTDVSYVAPGNEIEEKLVWMWQEILGKERIGIKDNFFDLGGHSLKIIKLITMINAAFLIRISIQSIFRAATIENIAEQVRFILDQNEQKKQAGKRVRVDL